MGCQNVIKLCLFFFFFKKVPLCNEVPKCRPNGMQVSQLILPDPTLFSWEIPLYRKKSCMGCQNVIKLCLFFLFFLKRSPTYPTLRFPSVTLNEALPGRYSEYMYLFSWNKFVSLCSLFPSKIGLCSPEINARFPLFPQTHGLLKQTIKFFMP